MSPPPRRSPLFSAVVLAGASLTAPIAACGETAPLDPDAGRSDSSPTSDAGGGEAEADAPPDAPVISDACPPGSGLSTPPCFAIK